MEDAYPGLPDGDGLTQARTGITRITCGAP